MSADERPPRLLFATSELTDFVKVGGLGDVSAALPRALRQTHDIRVLIPGYRQVLEKASINEVARLPAMAGLPACVIGRIDMADGLVVYVVLQSDLYDREGMPYGGSSGEDWEDNDLRFGRFSLAAAEIAAGLPELGWKPDLLHVNDWQASLAPAYLAWREEAVPSVLTIHNLAYQGVFDQARLPVLGVPEQAFDMEGVEFYGRMSFLKAGIYYSSHVTTVSSTYAHQITTPEFGCGLEGLLRTRASQDRLTGILNGVDESWDPQSDPHLAAGFDSLDLNGRKLNARDARETFGLEVSRGPLFAIISRLVHQKGIDIAAQAVEDIVTRGGQVAVTGQGEPAMESALRDLARRYPGNVGLRIGFDEAEARRLYAGSDFLLMPSRFEPCGLSQMYAQRYGSLPVAHRTGGLADTIEDDETGFLFSHLSIAGLMDGIFRAFDAFGSPRKMAEMRRKAMKRPLNWLQSSRRYGALYDQLMGGGGPVAQSDLGQPCEIIQA
ncbi:glycogen synthase GlgA [Mesorhizobium sp. CAU 1741]|uniref:glycogen synthase GlgA n=1 Tax=Mesorhizobium sp. CAU 1741 TaxID=3140366 RepID=UPI00325B030C